MIEAELKARVRERCRTYELRAKGRDMLAALVRVPEIDGTFLEPETLAGVETDVGDALAGVRAVLAETGIADGDLIRERRPRWCLPHRDRPGGAVGTRDSRPACRGLHPAGLARSSVLRHERPGFLARTG
ncbi:hypothetical protein [Streptomyces boncukensis]|uniref:Uncharacterized protein n=1 Tax=Streptomyces boncukensis TaxID=2711219 RepID=A0A6G4WX86_9ACTN|nr:hypothetical protein [Streptomyces boncukensis]NGO69896.1 hypothetical protein [Streptomyces boncukensis]